MNAYHVTVRRESHRPHRTRGVVSKPLLKEIPHCSSGMRQGAPTVELSEQLCKVSLGFLLRCVGVPFVAFSSRRRIASQVDDHCPRVFGAFADVPAHLKPSSLGNRRLDPWACTSTQRPIVFVQSCYIN